MITEQNKLECGLLGLILNDGNNLARACELGVNDSHFLDELNRKIWEACVKLDSKKQEIDLVTVGSLLEGDAPLHAVDCQMNAPVAQNFDWFANGVREASERKNLALELSALAQTVLKFGPGNNHEDLKTKLVSLAEKYCFSREGKGAPTKHIARVLEGYVDVLEQRVLDFKDGKPRGIPTGFKELDKLIGGLIPGAFYLIGARTSLGKTTLALNFANHAVSNGYKTVFFTNEMPSEQIAEKQISMRAKVFNGKIFTGNLEDAHVDLIAEAMKKMASLPFWINDRSGRGLEQFEREVKTLHRQHGLNFVIMDYIQQMRVEAKNIENRPMELAIISERMKQLAIDLKIPVIALAQLNRQGEDSEDAPTLAMFKDSDAMATASDCAIIIHRDREEENGPCELVIRKNRNGTTGKILVKTDLAFNLFKEP